MSLNLLWVIPAKSWRLRTVVSSRPLPVLRQPCGIRRSRARRRTT